MATAARGRAREPASHTAQRDIGANSAIMTSPEIEKLRAQELNLLDQFLAVRRQRKELLYRERCEKELQAQQQHVQDDKHGGSPPTIPQSQGMGKDKSWKELTAAERAAAAQIGYDEASWEMGDTPAACEKSWAKLSATERSAATTLGYTEQEWAAELAQPVPGPGTSGVSPPVPMPAARPAATPSPPPAAAGVQKKESGASSLAPVPAAQPAPAGQPSTPAARKVSPTPAPALMKMGKDKVWQDLTGAERTAAGQIGYDEAMWDAGETPAACEKHWAKLSATERKAATTLGYTEQEWDAELGPR